MRILTVLTDHWTTGAALNRAMQNARDCPSHHTLGATVILGYRADGSISPQISEDSITIKCATRRYDEAW